jgi:hypothetical protein
VHTPFGGRPEAAIGLDQPRPYRAEASPDVECFECQPQCLVGALAHRDAGQQCAPQLV